MIPLGLAQGGRVLARAPGTLAGRHFVIVGGTGFGKSGCHEGLTLSWLGAGLPAVVVDPKGGTGPELLAFLNFYKLLPADEIGVINFFARDSAIPLNPLVPLSGVDPSVQADLTVSFVTSQVDGVGQRQADALFWLARAAISRSGNLLDVAECLGGGDYAERYAAGVPDEEARTFLQAIGRRVPAASASALESRVRWLLRLPSVRAALCARSCLPLDRLLPRRGLVIADLGGAPSSDLADALGSLLVGLLTRAVFARRSSTAAWLGAAPPPCLVVLEEAQRTLRASAADVERLLCEARAFGVGLVICTQTRQNRVFDDRFLAVLKENTSYEIIFRPDEDAVAGVAHLLPIRGTRRNPSLPDRALTKREETDVLVDALRQLPRRHMLFVDRSGGQAKVEALRTLELPYGRAKAAFLALPTNERTALERGALAHPLTELLSEARPSLPGNTANPSARAHEPARPVRKLKVAF